MPSNGDSEAPRRPWLTTTTNLHARQRQAMVGAEQIRAILLTCFVLAFVGILATEGGQHRNLGKPLLQQQQQSARRLAKDSSHGFRVLPWPCRDRVLTLGGFQRLAPHRLESRADLVHVLSIVDGWAGAPKMRNNHSTRLQVVVQRVFMVDEVLARTGGVLDKAILAHATTAAIHHARWVHELCESIASSGHPVSVIEQRVATTNGKNEGHRRQALEVILGAIASGDVAALPPLPHLSRPSPPPKIVVMTQMRNVAHTLELYVRSVAWIADAILLLDTGSEDGTMAVARRLASTAPLVVRRRVTQGVDPQTAGWNESETYRAMLTIARKELGATHILTPDTDELLTWNWRRHGLLRNVLLSLPPKVAISMRQFHVYDGVDKWIWPRPTNGTWTQMEMTPQGWADDGVAHRSRRVHHNSRLPESYTAIRLFSTTVGTVHFKFASVPAMQVKTVWYKHLEYMYGDKRRAMGGYYAAKVPKASALSFTPVPLDAWYGPDLVDMAPRWLDPETYGWRLRMVQRWRARSPALAAAIPLPPEWPRLVKRTQRQWSSSDSFSLDDHCRTLYAGGDNGTMAVAAPMRFDRRLTVEAVRAGSQSFFWAMHDTRMFKWLNRSERHVRDFFERKLSARCTETPVPLVLDVGANSGFYGLWATAAGCRAVFVEPQPYCGWLIRMSLAANGWNDSVVLPIAAGSDPPSRMPVWCSTPCVGRVGAPGVPGGTGKPDGTRPILPITDSILQDPTHTVLQQQTPIAMVKVDTEGAEAAVLRGMWPLFKSGRIESAVVEVTPQFYRQRSQESKLRRAIHTELARIRAAGYRVLRPTSASPRDSRAGSGYVELASPRELKQYLLEDAFKQHDILLERVG